MKNYADTWHLYNEISGAVSEDESKARKEDIKLPIKLFSRGKFGKYGDKETFT